MPLGKQRFGERLTEGNLYEHVVARIFEHHGLTVSIEPIKRPDDDPGDEDHAGQIDLVVGDASPVHVEVKSSAYPFAGPFDFPFDWPRIDTTRCYDRKPIKPTAYVLISQAKLGMAVVWVEQTRARWRPMERWDGPYGAQREVYELPKADLRPFWPLVDWLVRREERRAA